MFVAEVLTFFWFQLRVRVRSMSVTKNGAMPPRRKRFQIHLSTAMVMMLVAGALIWANITARLGLVEGKKGREWFVVSYGWPLGAVHRVAFWYEDNEEYPPRIWVPGVVVDIAVALAILFAVWFFCEWLIRRRATWKGA